MKILLAFALVALTLSPGAQARPRQARHDSRPVPAIQMPGARCDLVQESVLADLPSFCVSEKVDSVRLVDFGNQLELLEKKCGQPGVAASLKQALAEKVHRRNPRTCTHLAEQMALQSRGARASVPPTRL